MSIRAAVALSDSSESRKAAATQKSIAVLYFENLSGVKEDEYLRDGITEDIVTELSKIKGLQIFSRATVLAYRDKTVTPATIGQQLNAAYVLTGSLRRAGARLRINAQLVDTHTDFPLWSERYDREMKDVFEVQDEIARSIADALRITLTPQEQEALAAKPTENLQAYDLYLRGRSYARRLTRQDLEFALQMFENAVALDPKFALAHAAIANAWLRGGGMGGRVFCRQKKPSSGKGQRGGSGGRARPSCHLALCNITLNRVEDASREATLAMALRPNDALVNYNLACVFCRLDRNEEQIEDVEECR